MAEITIDDIQKTVRDSFYVAVGLGVIAFQKAQVQRNDLKKQLDEGSSNAQQAITESMKTVEERLEAVEERIDAALDEVQGKLPDPASAALAQARGAAKEARAVIRKLVVPAT